MTNCRRRLTLKFRAATFFRDVEDLAGILVASFCMCSVYAHFSGTEAIIIRMAVSRPKIVSALSLKIPLFFPFYEEISISKPN